MAKSKIEWTDSTWNPVTGCTKISPGCQNCYAERMAYRLKAMGQDKYKHGFNLTTHEDVLNQPLEWSKPQNIFVNSMSDLFHEGVSEDFIKKVFEVMNKATWHRFQLLTKRSEKLEKIDSKVLWTPNIWLGVSVENADYVYRLESLKKTRANIKFVSIEPLIGSVGIVDLSGIDWVIVGGESGPKARPVEVTWVKEIRDQCISQQVPFFFKQWGGINKKKRGRVLEGRTWDEMPLEISI